MLRWTLHSMALVGIMMLSILTILRSEPANSFAIAFVSARDGQTSLYTMRPDGSNVHIVPIGEQRIQDYAPEWSLDGKWLYFVSSYVGRYRNLEIFRVHWDGSKLERLTDTAELDEFSPQLSLDTQQLAFITNGYDGNYEIHRLDLATHERRNLTRRLGIDEMPRWSPDGKWVAFATFRDGNRELYKIQADGTHLVNLTQNTGWDDNPRWSPDGQWIAFESNRDGSNNEIYRMRADGSEVHHLVSGFAPQWSPAGKWLAFERYDNGNREVYRMRTDGTAIRNLSQHSAQDWRVTWSADSQWLVFHSERDGNGEIYRVRIDGSGLQNLTRNPANDWHPQWSPRIEYTWHPIWLILGIVGFSLGINRK